MAKVTLTQDDANDFASFADQFGMTVHELFNHSNNARVMEAEAVSRGFDSPHFQAPVLHEDQTRSVVAGIHAFANSTVEVPSPMVPESMRDHPLVDMSAEPEPSFNPQQGSSQNVLANENAALKQQLAELRAAQSSDTPSKPRKADTKD